MTNNDEDSDAEPCSDECSLEIEDEFESAASDISNDASDVENAIVIDDDEDPIQDDFEDLLPFFPATPQPVSTVAVLKPEDAGLNVVQLTLKYAFGLHAFRGQQEVRLYCTQIQTDVGSCNLWTEFTRVHQIPHVPKSDHIREKSHA